VELSQDQEAELYTKDQEARHRAALNVGDQYSQIPFSRAVKELLLHQGAEFAMLEFDSESS